jgi:signal transduction histidine kinase
VLRLRVSSSMKFSVWIVYSRPNRMERWITSTGNGQNLPACHSSRLRIGAGFQFIHPEDVEENVRLWKQSIDTGEPFQFLHRFRGADGAYRWHLSRAHAMRDTKEAISMWIGSNTDFHEQKENQEELDRHGQELARSNAVLQQFAFAASHDLQEPLRMITSYSQLLVKGYRGQLDGEAGLCLKVITEGTKRMRDLLSDLLSYTQVNTDPETGQ